MTYRIGLVGVFCLLVSACGGGDDSPAEPPDPGGGGSVVRGGERLVWDQRAESVSAARGYTYILYIDGVRSTLGNVTCSGTASVAGYECSGTLPQMSRGPHTLQLAAVTSGAESSRSASLSVNVASSSALTTGTAAVLSDALSAGGPICIGSDGGDCYRPQLIAARAVPVRTIVPTMGDQALLLDGERSVSVIAGAGVLETPALTLEAETSSVIGLAVPPDFSESRFVYVAWRQTARDGQPEAGVTRYREVQGTLAEAATIVSGLPTIADASAPMAFDEAGRLYVQVPLRQATSSGAETATTAIMRFEADGSVPSDNPRHSPVIAYGFAQPSAMAWDAAGRRLWLAGADPQWSSPLATLDAAADSRAGWPRSPSVIPLSGLSLRDDAAPQVAINATAPQQERVWVVLSPGTVFQADIQAGRAAPRLTPVTFTGIADVGLVVTARDGSLLVASEPNPNANRPATVWRLQPVEPAAASRRR